MNQTAQRHHLQHPNKIMRGFTLIEILLVLVMISMIIFFGMKYVEERTDAIRSERASIQMQQILNAGLAYYIANNTWPKTLNDLQPTYLSGKVKPPFDSGYASYDIYSTTSLFFVYIKLTVNANVSSINPYWASDHAHTIANMLPMGYSSSVQPPPHSDPHSIPCSPTSKTCFAIGMVNIPGQNLNNASAVNYSGLYHSGACVPTPRCPVDKDGNTMTPQIFVAPVEVNGINDNPNGGKAMIYPISSFRAFAKGPMEPSKMENCKNTDTTACSLPSGAPTNIRYWRVCIQGVTEKGLIDPDNDQWGIKVGTAMIFTRCAIKNEPSGSDFNIWSP